MPARKEHRSDAMPTELERDAKCGMDPLLAGALLHRLSDIDLIRLNSWIDGERRAAADELWARHKDMIGAANDLLDACKTARQTFRATSKAEKDYTYELNALNAAISKAEGK